MLLVSTTRIIPGRAVPSFLSGRYSAVKVRKKLYVTRQEPSSQSGQPPSRHALPHEEHFLGHSGSHMRLLEQGFLRALRFRSDGCALKPSLRPFLLSSRETLVASTPSSRDMWASVLPSIT